MQKKTYMKPLVSLYAMEASTILAGSTKPSTPHLYNPLVFLSKTETMKLQAEMAKTFGNRHENN